MAQPGCPHCHGTGWKIVEHNAISGAERCDCGSVDRTRNLELRANIPPLYSKASLDNFVLPQDNQMARRELADVVTVVRAFQRNFPDEKTPGLLLMGDPGSGKTHLAVATLRALMARGHEGLFFDYQNLLDRIRAGYSSESGTADKEAYRFALECEVLLLDDLGAHRVTDWVEDTVTAIITHRCNHRKPLIATTNLTDPERASPNAGKIDYRISLTDRIGARARSRLFEMCKVIRMPLVEDYRMRRPAFQ